jgi:hypothetical protein
MRQRHSVLRLQLIWLVVGLTVIALDATVFTPMIYSPTQPIVFLVTGVVVLMIVSLLLTIGAGSLIDYALWRIGCATMWRKLREMDDE